MKILKMQKEVEFKKLFLQKIADRSEKSHQWI